VLALLVDDVEEEVDGREVEEEEERVVLSVFVELRESS
jgi:hypothetical protein